MIAKIKLNKFCTISTLKIDYDIPHDAILLNRGSFALISDKFEEDFFTIPSNHFRVVKPEDLIKNAGIEMNLEKSINLLKPKRVLMEFE